MFEMSPEEVDNALRGLARAIARAKRVVVLTGAGISVAAGIPDFRSNDGMWRRYDPKVYASYANFLKHPEMFWKMSTELRRATRGKRPTKAHFALAGLRRMGKLQTLITQNVDNLHQLAGVDDVIELHGTGKVCKCVECDYCGNADVVLPDGLVPWIDVPRCPKCGGLVKLDVVLFGEQVERDVFERAFDAASSADVLVVIGSSLEVMPANVIPRKAKMNFATVGFLNKSSTRLDDCTDYIVRGDSEDLVPRLVEYVSEYMNLSCVDTVIDSAVSSLRMLRSPVETITQVVAMVVSWASGHGKDEDVPTCLVDSSDVVEPAVTGRFGGKERVERGSEVGEDKVMAEILESSKRRD